MKKEIKIIITVLIVFAAVNVIWLGWSHAKYDKLSQGMEENDFSSFIVPRYCQTDEEGYDYGVKYPDYLSLTGNMSLSLPSTEEVFFTDALIIWPKLDGQYEFGVLLDEKDGTNYQEYAVYIDREGEPLSEEDREIVTRHKENIELLLKKADERWGILD